MANPVDAGRAATSLAVVDVSPLAVNLPASIASGDLLIMLVRIPTALTISTPSGWTQLFNGSPDASDDVTAIFWRKADGTEGGTVALTISGDSKLSAIVWRITVALDPTVTPPELSSTATGTSTTPDPPSFSPAGGNQEYLFLWLGGWEGEQTSPPAGQPTNYSNPVGANTGTAGVVATNCRVAGASRQLTITTHDPASWAISVSDDWSAWSLAIRPAAAAAPGPAMAPRNRKHVHLLRR